MKQLFTLILLATMAAFVAAGCSDDGNEPQPDPAPDPENPVTPSFSWAGQNMDAIHPIEVDANGALLYSAVIEISAPGKIAALTVDITSPLINDEYDIDKLDLIHPDEAMSVFLAMAPGLPVGEQIAGLTSCTFDITALLPQLAESTGEHDFAVTVTDEKGQSADQTFRFSSVNPDDPSFSWVDANGRAIDQNAVYNVGADGTVDGQYPPVIEISVPRQIAALTLDFVSEKDKYNDQGLIPLDLINPDADMLSFITQFNLPYGVTPY